VRAGLADAVQAPRACAAACPPIVIALAGVCLSMKQAEGYVKMPSTEPPVPSNVARDSVRRYLVVADRATGESAFSITFPAFPGLTSVALCDADIESQACDALATMAKAFLEDGEDPPPSVEGDALPAFDRIDPHDTRGFLVAVETGKRG